MKIAKKIIIGLSITILAIFLVLLVSPVLFKGKILEMAKKELNNMLTAKVDFADLKLSFIRNFPNAYIALIDLSVEGMGDFEGETIAAFDRLSLTVDLLSVIKMQNIEVKSVLLDQPLVFAHVLEDGRANWDIMKPAGEAAEIPTVDIQSEGATATPQLKIALNKLEIRNAGIGYTDDSSKMDAVVDKLNLFLKGDMTLDNADLNLKLDAEGINFRMDGIRLLNNAKLGLASDIAADIKNMIFTLKDNQLNLNEIILKFAGSAALAGDDINLDLAFATERTDFKSLLSMIPAVYMKDFESITTTGSLSLNGYIKGTFNDTRMPNVGINLLVNNAMFKYPDLPRSVDNINIDAKVFYDGAIFDNTTIDVEKLSFTMAGNPFNAELHVKTPESDMDLAAKFAGIIDINSISDIVPVDNITLNGLLECDLALAGRLSAIEKEQYEDFNAEGMILLSNFDFISPDLPQAVKINNANLYFTPRRVNLVNLNAVLGSTDAVINGSLENFIPFALKGETVRGNLNLRSENIDLNELMSGDAEESSNEPSESAPLSVIEVPKNIDLSIDIIIRKIVFDKLNITNTGGRVLVKDGKAQMQNLVMNLLQGSMTLNGEYNTEDIEIPSISFGMDIRQFDISSALSSFSILEKILPNPQNYTGRVSANLTLSSILGEDLNPVLDTVVSKGRLQTQNVKIENSKIFGTMADLIKNESWRTPSPGNLNIGYEIKDGRLIIEPVLMNISQARFELSGDQGLDMSLNYRVGVGVPVSTIGSAATNILSKIPGGSNVREIRVSGLVTGTADSPNVNLDVADMAGTVVEAVKEQVMEKVEEVKEQIREGIDEQINNIMAEAERQVQNIRNTASQSAARLRNEANNAAAKLEKEAEGKSAIQQRLTQAAADKVRSEGEDAAAKVEREAEVQANAILDAARKRADGLRNG